MGEIKTFHVQAHKAREEQCKLEHQMRELKVMEKRNTVFATHRKKTLKTPFSFLTLFLFADRW